jgi:micrococcal nuclease
MRTHRALPEKLDMIRFRPLPQLPRVVALLLAIFLSPAALHGASETGKVVKVIDGDTIKVSIGGRVETIRLIGVDTPEVDSRKPVEIYGKEATEFTRRLSENKEVRLEPDPQGDTRDTYGRLLRYVYLPDGTLLNAEIIRQGYGHAYTRFPFTRLEGFRALEREARQAGRGLWGAAYPKPLASSEAGAHVGETATVCGVVASATYATRVHGAPTFLNLDRPYPDHPFTIVIWETDRSAFGEPEVAYANRSVCVTGKIDTYRGKPQIVARDPSQIEIRESR